MVVIVIVSTLIALLSVLFTQNNTLPAFVAEPLPESEESPLEVMPTMVVTDEQMGITIEVPEDWRQVVIRGDKSFLHENGTMIQLQYRDYSPHINMMNGESIRWDVEINRGIFHDYVQINNTSAIYSYTLNEIEHIHYLTWDRMTIVGVKIEVHREFYDLYFGTFMHILDNFHWEKQNPIPENFIMLYNEFGSFEFGVPANWGTAITEEGVFLASSPDTGVVMYVNVFQNDTNFEGVSQIEYSNVIGHGRSSFILREFFNDGRSIYADAMYTANNRNFMFLQHMISNGAYHYTFTLEAPTEYAEEARYVFSTAVSLFRFG